nr:hypothetical protein DBT53_11535 [Aerococcus mictus]
MTTSAANLVAAVDAFLKAPKRIIGADSAPVWRDGFSPAEVEMKYPLEIEGEMRGASLMVVGFPRERALKFRLGILFPAMVCRVDFTDEVHANTLMVPTDGIPGIVKEPHYHSWSLNRRFFRAMSKPPKLHNAEPLPCAGRSFDAVLRWFCTDTNIEALPPGHMIELPKMERLL